MAGRRKYDWDESNQVADKAVKATLHFLSSEAAKLIWDEVKLTDDASNNKFYQQRDTDLRLIVRQDGELRLSTVEVKGDRLHKFGNFFLETLSDIDRETTGAFLACEAEWYFYYFLEIRHLHCIPMAAARSWFNEKCHLLKERDTSSVREGRTWRTRGRLAPIKTMKAEVPGITSFEYSKGWRVLGR